MFEKYCGFKMVFIWYGELFLLFCFINSFFLGSLDFFWGFRVRGYFIYFVFIYIRVGKGREVDDVIRVRKCLGFSNFIVLLC